MLASGLQGDAHGRGAEPALCNTDTNLTPLVKWESWPGILSQLPMTNLTSKLFYEDSSGQKMQGAVFALYGRLMVTGWK